MIVEPVGNRQILFAVQFQSNGLKRFDVQYVVRIVERWLFIIERWKPVSDENVRVREEGQRIDPLKKAYLIRLKCLLSRFSRRIIR